MVRGRPLSTSPRGSGPIAHTADRVGRTLAVVGALLIWVPFTGLAGLSVLASLSGPGLPERDWPIALLAAVIVVGLPVALVVAVRPGGRAAILVLALAGAAVPLLYASLVQPDYSEPLQLLRWVAATGGGAIVLGALLMIGARRSGHLDDR